jgi:serine/threonine-protein kinase
MSAPKRADPDRTTASRSPMSGTSQTRSKASTKASSPGTSPPSGLVPLAEQDIVEMPFAPGEMVAGKYEIVGLIGSGGMGYVVAALHVELGELVALKFLRQEALAQEELVERFAREARAAVKIKSEYVARVMDVGSLPGGVPFIVMEHLEGKDLADVLAEQGRLPVRVAVEYMMQACEALASAHANGIVHRDVKPENLFLTRHAQSVDIIKVLDFGISKLALTSPASKGSRQFVRTMLPMGSPTYMSPEQIRSAGEVDARTDIWSLGCVLFELLTGTTAFDAPTLMQLSAAILEKEPTPLCDLLPDAPPELEAVLQRCLEKDVNKRYQNIAELAVALYPFAPRRARISAERCSYLLRDAGLPAAEIDFASVAPPAGENSERKLAVTIGGAPLTTTTPAVMSPTPSVPVDAFKPRRKGWAVAIAAAAVVAIVAIWQLGFSESEPVAEAPVKAPERTVAAATPAEAAIQVAPQAKPAEPSAAKAKTSGPAGSTPAPTVAPAADTASADRATRSPPSYRPRAPAPRPKARPASGAAGRARNEEPDVGY